MAPPNHERWPARTRRSGNRSAHSGSVHCASGPIGATEPGGAHPHDNAVGGRRWIGHVDQTQRTFECVVANGFHWRLVVTRGPPPWRVAIMTVADNLRT